jgi:hypothetical protein
MATSTLRPNGTISTDGAVTGAASAHAALSDDSDSSYVALDGGTLGETWLGDFGDFAPSAGAVVASVRLRYRILITSPGSANVFGAIYNSSGTLLANATIAVNWTAATTATWLTLTDSSLSEADLDGIRASVTCQTSGRTVRVIEAYIDVVYVPLPEVSVDEPTGTVDQTNQPAVIWTPEPTVTVSTPNGRSRGDCVRAATAIAYPTLAAYDDLPDDQFVNGGVQARALDAWAARRGLRWWRSWTSAPTSGVWLAVVDSPAGEATHVVVMHGRRLYADPANHFTPRDIGPLAVRGAWVLARATDPWWTSPAEFWRLPRPWVADAARGE